MNTYDIKQSDSFNEYEKILKIYPELTPVILDDTSDAVRTKLNTELFEGFSNTVFDKIRTQGIDLDRITQNNREVLSGNRIGYHITDSNLQRLGIVNDLQTSGENFLSETLYIAQKRIGINTMDPDATVSIWDQEVEITISKQSQDTAQIGSPRNQALVVQSNNKQNLVARPDGSVQIDNLKIGDTQMTYYLYEEKKPKNHKDKNKLSLL